MPSIGDPVKYHSPYSHDVYDARITRINDDGTVALAVQFPNTSGMRENDFINLRSVSYGPDGRAKPRSR
jgi:hypothetical protein